MIRSHHVRLERRANIPERPTYVCCPRAVIHGRRSEPRDTARHGAWVEQVDFLPLDGFLEETIGRSSAGGTHPTGDGGTRLRQQVRQITASESACAGDQDCAHELEP